MSDFLQEVEEDLKRERAEKLWEKYSIYVYGLVVAIIASVAGYKYFDAEQTKKAWEAGAKYEAAVALSKDLKSDEAIANLTSIVAEGGRYKDIARLKLTSELMSKDAAGSLAGLNALSKDTTIDPNLRDIATLRLGFSMVDASSYDDVLKLIEPLSKSGLAFRTSALEIMGLSAYKTGKLPEATTHLNALVMDNDATESAKARAKLVLSLLDGAKK